MEYQEMKQYMIDKDVSLAQAMRTIDETGSGVLFLADQSMKLQGSLSDGDIRRFLLSGGKLEDPAISAANRHPATAYTRKEAKPLYSEKRNLAIPILDNNGMIIDIYVGEGKRALSRNALNVPVVINAGGRGSRLDPFTKVLPKPLILVGDHPIIELIMQEYQTYSCTDFHIIVNYKRELMKAYFSECENHYDITWYDEEKPLGTGGGLSLLRGRFSDTFFFANCDALLTADYDCLLQFHKEQGNVITMVCAYKNISLPYGIVEMGLNGVIEKMREKPILSYLTNTGIYVVEPEVLEDIEENVPIGFPDIVERERRKGRKVAVYPVNENDWMDMGQLSELEKMRARLFGE